MPTSLSSERDRAVLRSFSSRIDRGDAGAHNNLGVLYFNKGMAAEAVAEFTRALDLDPRMTIAQRNLEIAYFTSGYYDERVAVLRAQLDAHPDDADALWELGRTYALLDDSAAALHCFAALVREDPTNVRAMLQLALAESKGGEQESAARWLQHALEIDPDNAALHFHLGETAYHRGLNDQALMHLQRAVELSPEDADAQYLLGFVLGDMGKHEEARAHTKRAFQLNPSLGKAHANLSLERFDVQSYARAREVREARGLSGALEVAEEGQLAHFNLGLAFRQKGYLAEALREYRLALDRGEDRTLVLQAMAEVHLLRRESDSAVLLYDRLLADAPQSPKLWNERGVALHQEGKYTEARESYRRAIDSDAHYALARNNLAVVYFHEGRSELALGALRDALLQEPSFLKGRLNLALLLFRQGALEQALEAYRHTLHLSPEHAVAWNGVGLVLVQLGRVEEARNAFSRAIEAHANYAEAHYNLGFALSTLGDYAGSLRETKRALELDPYYAPQKFELAVDLEFEDPRFDVSSDLTGERRELTMDGFTFEERALDALFEGLGDPAAAPTEDAARATPVDASVYAPAQAAAARGEWDRARAIVNAQLAAGAPRLEGMLALGDVFLAQGAAGEAVERYREALSLSPTLFAAREGELRALVTLRRFRDARESAMAVEATPNATSEALLLAATVYAECDAIDAATRLRDRVRASATLSPESLQRLGDLARAMGDTAGAIDAYADAVQADAGLAAVRVQLAALLRGEGRHEEGEQQLVAALETVPTFADAALALAGLRRELGRPAESIDVLIPILEGNPFHLDALASLGESLFLAGRAEDAHFAIARVRRFDPEHVAALYFDGVFLAQRHEYAAAIARWRHVEELEPAGDFARRARRDARTANDALQLQRDIATDGAS